jgi:GH25 family lysozyme M1 (1,4-beta-N-acetylmuramidase)
MTATPHSTTTKTSRRVRARLGAITAVTGIALLASAIGIAPASADTISNPDAHHAGSQLTGLGPGKSAAPYVQAADVPQTPGMDVSSWQGNVDWQTAWNNGARFAYVKATESTTYQNPYFSQQYNGSYNVGMIRGGYHFAQPGDSGGAAQADYFVAHGGGWSQDGKTLPGMLDLEAGCSGLSQSSMVGWIKDFSDEYFAKTGRWVVMYTSTSWWSQCTGNLGDFSSTNPLDLANWNGSPGPMPFNWGYQTIWQSADSGIFPGDQDWFNGGIDRVQALANG